MVELLRGMTLQDVANHLNVSWDTVKEIHSIYLERHYSPPSLKGVVNIAFIASVLENCPGAVHVFDHFHVVKLMNDHLDDIRRKVYAKAVFLKAHFFGQKFKVLKVDKTLVDYYTKLLDFHAQFRAIGTNYNQVVKELRFHFSEKKAMALLYKLEKHTIDLVKLSREIVELSREMYAKWEQQN